MPKFRKKPVVIEAFQWDGVNVQGLADWAAQADFESRKRRGVPLVRDVELPIHVTPRGDSIQLEIDTINGTADVSPGEWVICGVHGEFYPCAAAIFDETYEAA